MSGNTVPTPRKKLFWINKLTPKSNVSQVRETVRVIRACFVGNRLVDWAYVLLLYRSKWGQCSVTLMDMSPALTRLPETHKPVTAASVNHYPATLYLVHICWFTGLWNVFSEHHWSNSGPIKLRCRVVSRAEADGPQSNGIIKSDKWQSPNTDSKMKRRLRMRVWLQTCLRCLTNLGILSILKCCVWRWLREWSYSLFWWASAMWRRLWSSGSCNDRQVSGPPPRSHSDQRRMLLALDSEHQQAG